MNSVVWLQCLILSHTILLTIARRGGRVSKNDEEDNDEGSRRCNLRLTDWDEDLAPQYVAIARVHGVGAVFGEHLAGVVRFEQQRIDGPTRFTGALFGLLPSTSSMMIIHDFGRHSCSRQGGHYNPTGNEHGESTSCNRHIGDLSELQSDENGTAIFLGWDALINLAGRHSIVGRNVAIYFNSEDELDSDSPSYVVGCGVIGWMDSGVTQMDDPMYAELYQRRTVDDMDYPWIPVACFLFIALYWYLIRIKNELSKISTRYKIPNQSVTFFHHRKITRLRLAGQIPKSME